MKLTFRYAETSNIKSVPSIEIYNSHFEIPDEVKFLIGYEQRIMALAEAIGGMTKSALFLTCAELGLKNHPVKTDFQNPSLSTTARSTILHFTRMVWAKTQQRQLRILDPIPIPENLPAQWRTHNKRLKYRRDITIHLVQYENSWCKTDTDMAYAQRLSFIAEQMLVLLAAESSTSPTAHWTSMGFHPSWIDNQLITHHQRRIKIEHQQEKKRIKQQSALARKPDETKSFYVPQATTTTTASPRAVPGVFRGVQFRSQLEIRFATELESREIRWSYEIERLSGGQYLVDFYLPDLRTWVEVKGKFEPRDHFLLKEVAATLEAERSERLFVYCQGKAYAVTPDAFTEIKHDEFWNNISLKNT